MLILSFHNKTINEQSLNCSIYSIRILTDIKIMQNKVWMKNKLLEETPEIEIAKKKSSLFTMLSLREEAKIIKNQEEKLEEVEKSEPTKGLGVFSKLFNMNSIKEENQESDKIKIPMDKIIEDSEDEYHFSKKDLLDRLIDAKLDKDGFANESEKKEFNKIMNGFIKNFNKIIKEENILKNIDI